jgi:hypothetical protein
MLQLLVELRRELETMMQQHAESAMKKPAESGDAGYGYLRGQYRGMLDALHLLDATYKRLTEDDGM